MYHVWFWKRDRSIIHCSLSMKVYILITDRHVLYSEMFFTPLTLYGLLTGLILGLRQANERRRYFVTTSLIIRSPIGWVQAKNQPCYNVPITWWRPDMEAFSALLDTNYFWWEPTACRPDIRCHDAHKIRQYEVNFLHSGVQSTINISWYAYYLTPC